MAAEADQPTAPASTCPRCGDMFVCGAIAGLERCWCMERPPLGLIPATGDACYCPACLNLLAKDAAG